MIAFRPTPLKYVTTYNDEVLPESFDPDGLIDYIEISDVDASSGITASTTAKFSEAPSRARRVVRTDDVLISTVRTYLRAIASVDANHDGSIASTGFCVLRPSKVHPGFLKYAASNPEFVEEVIARSTGISYPAINATDLVRLSIPTPSRTEQAIIAKFLDRETAQIDDLIAKQERLIELLAEKRQAIITHAVTKGLDPTAPIKPSGIPWLGDIPAHWADSRLKFALKRIEQGVSPQAERVPASQGSWGVLKSGCVNGGIFRESQNKQLPIDFTVDPAIVVQVGDLLVSRASGSPKLVGSAARVRSLNSCLILSDKTFRFVPKEDIDADFLEWYLNSQLYREQVAGSISGAEGLANNISTTALKNIRLPLPPKDEQTQISTLLRLKTDALARLEGGAAKAIELLRERRAALISAAVTGKLAVSI